MNRRKRDMGKASDLLKLNIEELGLIVGDEKGNHLFSRKAMLAAVVIGFALRMLAVTLGDISPGGDGTQRLALALSWANDPTWDGLSGVWPPSHWYLLGTLISIWDEPIILAKLIGLACGMGAVVMLASAVRPIFGNAVASVSALLLAICWTHIWLTSSYWVELPYMLFVFLAVYFSTRLLSDAKSKDAILSGLFLSLAILLRHEGLVLLGLFLIWYALNVKNRKMILVFAALPVCVSAWHFIEPLLSGHSYFEYVAHVRQAKAGENLVQGFTLKDCLYQWVMMPAVVPSLFIVLPGFYGLWRARRLLRYDLFAWMFSAQVGFYFLMTFTSGWRPQLRYIMLYFVNLFPYAALAWVTITRRWRSRYVLASLVVLTMLTQAAGWWVGRNKYRPMGWLPLEVRSSSQKAVDDWMSEVSANSGAGLKVIAFTGDSIEEPWSLLHSVLVNRIPAGAVKTIELYVPEEREILNGQLPPVVSDADLVVIDPDSGFYSTVVDSISKSDPGVRMSRIHPRITIMALSHRLEEASARKTGR